MKSWKDYTPPTKSPTTSITQPSSGPSETEDKVLREQDQRFLDNMNAAARAGKNFS